VTRSFALSRRSLLASALAGTLRPAGAAEVPLRLLVMADLAAAGSGPLAAARMAVEEFGGGIGRPVAVVSADAGGDPARGALLARRWIGEDGVAAVIVLPDDDVAPAVQVVCREQGRIALFCGPTAPALSGSACSPTGFQWNGDAAAIDRTAAIGLAGLGVTAARVPGASARAAAMRARLAVDGIADADGGMTVLVGPAPVTAGPVMLAPLRPAWLGGLGAAASGALAVTPFDWTLGEGTRAWARRFAERIGRLAEPDEIGVYEAVRHYLLAVARLGRSEGPAVARQMRFTPVESVFTRGAEIAADGRVMRELRLVRITAPGRLEGIETLRVVPPEETPRRSSAAACAA